MALVYSQDFAAGNGSQCPPESGAGAYESSTWAGGVDTPDVVYPELRFGEDCQIGVGEGPSGENVIKSFSGDPADGAFAVSDIGDLTTPNGATGWWNATEGRQIVDINLEDGAGEFYTSDVTIVPLQVLGRNAGRQLWVEFNPVDPGEFNIKITYNTLAGQVEVYDTGDVGVASISVAEGFTDWHTMRLRWQCGSTNDEFVSVNSDGFITVDFGAKNGTLTRVIELLNIPVVINDGYQTNQADSASTTFVGSAIGNWARGAALGYHGLLPSTNWEVYNTADPLVGEGEEQVAAIWRLDVGGAGSGTGTGDEGGGDSEDDPSGAAEDNGEGFIASLVTRPLNPRSILNKFRIRSGAIVTRAAQDVEIEVSLIGDFGEETPPPQTVNLSPRVQNQTHIITKIDDLRLGEAKAVQIKISDTNNPQGRWNIEQVALADSSDQKAN